jgi:hypothetical protein
MASFPKLSTGAPAQYGASYESAYRTRVIRYVDGTEQRYADCGASLRRWTIPLAQLTPAEVSAVVAFFREQRGQEGTFSFTDPWTGVVHEECCFDAGTIRVLTNDEWNASTTITIREVKP